MNGLVIAVLVVLVILAAVIKVFMAGESKIVKLLYQKHTALFSADEQVFFKTLKEAMGDEYEIFGKIRATDIARPKKGSAPDSLNPIAGRYFDFVLCDKNNLAVVCAIQLHDKTHPSQQAENLSNPLKTACQAISLPFVRIAIKAEYSIDELRNKLAEAMREEPLFLIETDGRKEPHISNIEDMKF